MGTLGSKNSNSHALVANSKTQHKNTSKWKQTQTTKECNSSNHSPKKDCKGKKSPLKCAFCGKEGHLESRCFKKLVVLSTEIKKLNAII
jgi:hypothetical protein